MRARALVLCAAALAALAASGCHECAPLDPAVRPARWARPLRRPGLPNLHRVSDRLYRGAQPDREGFRELCRLGVRTVVNLRSAPSDRGLVQGLPLRCVELPARAWEAEDRTVAAFLRIAVDADAPVFVHCRHGADRTGLVCAAYRMAVQGWDREEAIEEMRRGGFGHHAVWSNLSAHLRRLDVGRLRRLAGLEPGGVR